MITVAGSISGPGGLGPQPVEVPGRTVPDWLRDVQAEVAHLIMGDARQATPGASDLALSASVGGADPVAAARLEGVRLTAREIAHLVNNDLALAVGTLDLLLDRPDVPPHLQVMLDQVLSGLHSATRHVEQLQRVKRVVTHETPAGPSLDLERST